MKHALPFITPEVLFDVDVGCAFVGPQLNDRCYGLEIKAPESGGTSAGTTTTMRLGERQLWTGGTTDLSGV